MKMKKMNIGMISLLSLLLIACGNNATQHISIESDDEVESAEETDTEPDEETRDVNEEYAGFGKKTLILSSDSIDSTISLDYEDDNVLIQTYKNAASFENIDLTYEDAQNEVEEIESEYGQRVGVTYEHEMIEAGINEDISIDYRSSQDVSSYTLSSLLLDEVITIPKGTSVEEAIERFEAEGYEVQ